MSSTYQITRDELYKVAMQHCLALGQGEAPVANDIADITPHLQMMLKYWDSKGYNTWLYKTISFAAIANRSTGYTIGEAGSDVNQARPVRITQAYTRDSNNNDIPLIQISRQDYELLTPKATPGPPNSYYYDRGVPADLKGIFYPWPILADTSLTFFCLCQRPISDLANSGTATFDVEQEWMIALGWNLAEQIMGMYGTEENQCRRIEKNAARFLEECSAFTEEDAPIQFTPSMRGGGFRGRR